MNRFSFLRLLVAVLVFLAVSVSGQAQTYLPTWESIDSRPVPQWFANAKFGIFIHWGIYSVPAWAPAKANVSIYDKYAEWYWQRIGTPPDNNQELNKVRQIFTEHHHRFWGANFKYQDFAPLFRAEYFQPEEWAELFRQAGAKYVVLTSKHHEGFTLWPSPLSWNWNAVDIGPHRDLCGDLAKAVRDKGLRMGFYYSLYEWFNPLYHANVNKYVDDYMIPQMKDLVTRYSPDILWTDGEWDHPSSVWKSTEFLAWLYNESPVKDRIVVNDRWGKETRSKHGGFFSTEYDDMLKSGKMKIGEVPRPWEECRGIGSSFGYNRAEMLDDYQTSAELIHLLINKVAAGGNLLLNIGPTADGRIPVIMQQRLMDMGAWLKVNGEAIYDTQVWQGRKTPHGQNNRYFTAKGKDLYLILTKWTEGSIEIEGIKNPSSVSMLGWNGRVNARFAGNKLTIQPPAVSPANMPCQYAWVFKFSNAL